MKLTDAILKHSRGSTMFVNLKDEDGTNVFEHDIIINEIGEIYFRDGEYPNFVTKDFTDENWYIVSL